jgi:tRNA pseudouridine13 synthase
MSTRFNLGGDIKVHPADFIVEETWPNRTYNVTHSALNRLRDAVVARIRRPGDYLHFTMVKQNWTTVKALRHLKRRLGVSLKRFGISGMKDKRAVTAQRVSMWHGEAARLARIAIPDIWLKDYAYADKRINLGEATGNRFTVTIRNIPHAQNDITATLTRFTAVTRITGLPNYYGPQRFSGQNAEIGEAIRMGDLKKATELLLAKLQPAMKKGGLAVVPDVFWYEKLVAQHLLQHPNDYAGALRRTPKKILRIFPHAYQSRIFNERLRRAIERSEVPPTITIDGFKVNKMPELSTHSVERSSRIRPINLRIVRVQPGQATIRFSLGSGEYATTILSQLID